MAGKNAESIYKVIEVIGTSSTSWADAGKNGSCQQKIARLARRRGGEA